MIAIRDLQIGDFINTENNGVVQITVLSWRAVGYEGGASTPEHCSYIPLTEEILAKNGFVKTWNGDWQLKEYSTIIISKDYYVEIFERSIKIDYVHELQHLLWQAGVQKEIEL